MIPVKVGYSCWGFLGSGITDTPDGGRSHRPTLVRALVEHGMEVIMLQQDRDRLEAGTPIDLGQTYSSGTPTIDLLFLEWRWPILGRNTDPTIAGYTPDWHRQQKLLENYCGHVPVIVWDKDQQLSSTPPRTRVLLEQNGVSICVPTLVERIVGRSPLPFPFDPSRFNPNPACPADRDLSLVYVGNDYGRWDDFFRWILPAADHVDTTVIGKWEVMDSKCPIHFAGRVGFPDVSKVYRRAVGTILLAPKRYKLTGQFTQRIYEALCEGCMPLCPLDYVDHELVMVPELILRDPEEVVERLRWLRQLPIASWHDLLERQRNRLSRFDVNHIVKFILTRLVAWDI